VKEGNLEKKSRFLGIWRKRWTVLAPTDHDSHHNLTTHKEEKVYDNPTEVIRVDRKTNAGPTRSVTGAEHRAFIVQNTNGRSTERFLFRATSREERDEWLQSIKQLQGSRSTTAASSNGSHRGSRHPTKSFLDSGDSKVMEEPADSEQSQTVQSAASSSKHDQLPNGAAAHESPKTSNCAVVSPQTVTKSESTKESNVNSGHLETEEEPTPNAVENGEEEEELPPPEMDSADTTLPTTSPFGVVSFADGGAQKNTAPEAEEEEEEELPPPEVDSADTTLPTTSPFGVVSFADDNTRNNKNAASEPEVTEPSKEEIIKTEHVEQQGMDTMDTIDTTNAVEQTLDVPSNENPDDVKEEEVTQEVQSDAVETKEDGPTNTATGVETEDDMDGDEQERPSNEPKKEMETEPEKDVDTDLNLEQGNQSATEKKIEAEMEPEPEPQPQGDTEVESQITEEVTETTNERDNDDDVNEALKDDNPQNTDRNDLIVKVEEVKAESQETEVNAVNEVNAVEDSINAEEAEDCDEADDNVGDIVDFNNLKAMRRGAMATLTPMADDDKESSVSSFRSDGDGPFGDRWGDWNETEEDTKEPTPAMTPVTNERTPAASTLKSDDIAKKEENEPATIVEEATVDQNVEETKEEEEEPILDTSGMKCGNIVVIGGESSNKSILLQTLLDKECGTDAHDKTDKVLTNDSGDSVLCSFHDTSSDVNQLQSTISAIATSDIALIAVSMKDDELQSSLDSLRDTMLVLNTFGVERCICCLSGIDALDYDEDRYQKARDKMSKMIKKIGIKLKKVAFIPVDIGNERDNITTAATELMPWYNGWTLKLKREERKGMTVVDALQTMITHFAHKKGEKLPFVLPISKVMDDGVICGKIEQGVISVDDTDGDKQLVMAFKNEQNENVSVERMSRSSCNMECCKIGDYVSMSVSEMKSAPRVGDVLYLKNDDFELKAISKITALVVMLSSTPLEVGSFEGMICIRSNAVQCGLTKIHWKSSGKDGKVHDAQSLKDKEQGQVELTLKEPMVISTFEQCESLGRFVILHGNRPVLQGKIESVDEGKEEDDGDDYY